MLRADSVRYGNNGCALSCGLRNRECGSKGCISCSGLGYIYPRVIRSKAASKEVVPGNCRTNSRTCPDKIRAYRSYLWEQLRLCAFCNRDEVPHLIIVICRHIPLVINNSAEPS